jgi:DNA-binding transcriptional LysR family regulator
MMAAEMVFDLLIHSTSALATTTMPILTPIAHLAGVSGQVTVTALLLGSGLTNMDAYIGHVIEGIFERHKVKVQSVLVTNLAPTLCEFVAAGLGVSLVHTLMLSGLENRLAVRRFERAVPFTFQLCRSAGSRNAPLVEAFAQESRDSAAQISRSMPNET